MKKRSTLVWFFASALTMLAIVACGKSGSDGGGNVAPAPVGPSVVVPAGTQIGFFAQNSKMDWLYPDSAGFSTYQFQSAMYKVLKYAMRTCDRGAFNGGTSACQSWLSGPNDIMIFANGSQASAVKMVIRSMPDMTCQSPYSCSTYWYSLPSFTQFILGGFGFNTFNNSNVYNPMILNMTIWPVNDSKGFELRGYAPGGDLYYGSGNLLFQFQVPNGKLEDAGWDYQLVFNGEVAATGHMVRCHQPNCKVEGF